MNKRKTENRTKGSPNIDGFLPPQAVEMEEAVLGAVLLEKGAIDRVLEVFNQPEVFYKEAHHEIFNAILELNNKGEPVDILTVTKKIKSYGKLEIIGGAYYITTLTNRVASSANIEYHARIVYQKYLQRRVIEISSLAQKDAYTDDTDILDLIGGLEAELSELYSKTVGSNSSGELTPVINQIVSSFNNPSSKELTGVHTGNQKLNEITGGFQKSDLIILAARPGVGKTARALKIARSAWKFQRKKGIIFSLEMSRRQIIQRIISSEGKVNSKLFIRPGLATEQDKFKLNKGASAATDLGFEIYDRSAINITYLRSVCKKFIKKHGTLDYIIVDYLQLMKDSSPGNDKNREQVVSDISGGLKALAKELDVPIIALSQLSRTLEARSDKRPLMSDLRESGSLEQDADIVIFLYRPSKYYDINDDVDYNGAKKISKDPSVNEFNYDRLVELSIAKHRNGESDAELFEEFIGEHYEFNEWVSEPTGNWGSITSSTLPFDGDNPF